MGAMLGKTCGPKSREVVARSGEGHGRGVPRAIAPDLDEWIDLSSTPGLSTAVAEAHRNSTREGWSKFLGAGLMEAASDGNLAGVKQLLSCGAPVRSRDAQGLTPLHRASVAGHAGVAGVLLLDGEDAPPVGASSPPPTSVEQQQQQQQQPPPPRLVWQASREGPLLVPSVSLRKKAKLDARDVSGSCPVHLAAACGHAQVVQVLLQHGADISSGNGLKQTPLHAAAGAANPANSLRLLLDAGGDVGSRDSAGRTPLHFAASVGTPAAISILVESGADLEARGSISNRTALHDACASLRAQNVKRLLDVGADERAVDSDDLTPMAVLGESVSDEEVMLDRSVAEAEESIRRYLDGAPKDRRWRRRRLLPLLQRRLPPPGFETGRIPAVVGADSDMWIVDRAAILEPGLMRNVVSYL
ncbi:unnamed protein product [Scytosiphon promiscuus]